MTSSVHQVLVGAKGHLLNRGWRQGSLGEREGSVCMRGALFVAQGWDEFEKPGGAPRPVKALQVEAEEALRRVLDLEPSKHAVIDWNDMAGRSIDEVIAALDRAILEEVRARPEISPGDEPLHAAVPLHGRQPDGV